MHINEDDSFPDFGMLDYGTSVIMRKIMKMETESMHWYDLSLLPASFPQNSMRHMLKNGVG